MITNKIIYLKDAKNLDKLLEEIKPGLNPVIFIESTKQIYTCGTFFNSGDSNVSINEKDGKVSLTIGSETINFSTQGSGISISKSGNSIVFSSSALTSGEIKTDDILVWDRATKKMSHASSGVIVGNYGQSSKTEKAQTFVVPRITVNSTGHVTNAENITVSIRDQVEQKTSNENLDRPILAAISGSLDSETGEVIKSSGVTINTATHDLKVKGGISAVNGGVRIDSDGNLHIKGNIIVDGVLQGNSSGTAIPKVHLSDKPQYGGASTELYGHVRLQDNFERKNGVIIAPNSSSDNKDNGNEDVVAIAASPLMVYNALQEAKKYVTTSSGGVIISGYDSQGEKRENINNLNLTHDFAIDESGNVSLAWFNL
jgi:hypothetical protein